MLLAGCSPAAGRAPARAQSQAQAQARSQTQPQTRSQTQPPAPRAAAGVQRTSPANPVTVTTTVPTTPASLATTVTTTVSATSPASTRTVQIVVIGDSLTSGHLTPGYPWTTPAQQILDQQHLAAHLVNASAPGIGYATAGSVGVTFADLARQVVTPRTDIVVLFGSDNDDAGPALDRAVDSTVDLVQALAPLAAVVIVGPPATPAQQGRDLTGIVTALRTAATRAGATFVDATDWFAGRDATLLSSDDEHPSEAGEDYLGSRFAALLEPLIRRRLHG